jgi:hypothetical protein
VFIGIGRSVTACGATKCRLSDAILLRCVPKGFAAVGGVPGVDLNPGASSFFRFGAQY